MSISQLTEKQWLTDRLYQGLLVFHGITYFVKQFYIIIYDYLFTLNILFIYIINGFETNL